MNDKTLKLHLSDLLRQSAETGRAIQKRRNFTVPWTPTQLICLWGDAEYRLAPDTAKEAKKEYE